MMLWSLICSGTPIERPFVNHDHAIELTLHFIRISDKTHWLFVELTLGDGRKGIGEATLPGKDAQVLTAA